MPAFTRHVDSKNEGWQKWGWKSMIKSAAGNTLRLDPRFHER